MSHTKQQVMVQLRTACKDFFLKQMNLLSSSERVSSRLKEQNLLFFLNLDQMENFSPFPTVSDPDFDQLTTASTDISSISDDDGLSTRRQSVMDWMNAIHQTDIKPESIGLAPLTDDLVNRAMIDLLFLMKDKIRATRRRLNDDGANYDKDAYVAARNQANLAQSIYIEQLHRDLVKGTPEDKALLEQVRYPEIEDATAANFVESIQNLVSFMQARIIAPLAA